MSVHDTIAAIATPPGQGGVSIIRISGPAASDIATTIAGICPGPRHAVFANFRDCEDQLIDQGLIIFFPGPNSFTGEDIVELHGHGGVVVSDQILTSVLKAGARMARPGEFSERAFLNDKMDLVQAEAIADLISAGSRQAARAAVRTLEGEFSSQIHELVEELISLRVFVESALDFADEEIEFINTGGISSRLFNLKKRIETIIHFAHRGRVLAEGMQIVIAGKPNAGKSSLMNALCGRDTAIVTDIPGTTRDILREQVLIDGIPVHLHDTAGLRDNPEKIEEEGIRRARDRLSNADIIIWIHDDKTELIAEDYAKYNLSTLILVRNKIDLSGRLQQVTDEGGVSCVSISIRENLGLDDLRNQIVKQCDAQPANENEFSARRRHLVALENVLESLESSEQRLHEQLTTGKGGELLAEELRQAQTYLDEITGEFSSDDLLGRIFSQFCIGK